MSIKTIALSAAFAATAFASNAATISDGTYFIQNDLYDSIGETYERAVWAPGLGENKLWSVKGQLNVSHGGTVANLSGKATNVENLADMFSFSIDFAAGTGNGPYCQFGGDRTCPNGIDADWHYFDILEDTSSISGIGGSIDGKEYSIENRSAHIAQIGTNADALNIDGNVGMSFWFNYTDNETGKTKNGDFNFDIINAPLPAASWLLLAGVGGLAAAGRRRK